ncbi:hypothetical protein IFM89_004480, partial [Coptis chinensis]
ALGCVKLTDLIASGGLPSDSYKISISTLSQSLAQYSAAIIQLPAVDAQIYTHQIIKEKMQKNKNKNDTTFLFTRPGLTSTEPNNTIEFPPAGIPDMFSLLGKADRDILDAICFSLNMRSSAFTGILDNVPLKVREISSSVLSVCCHLRPSLYQGAQHHSLAAQEDEHLAMFSDHEHQAGKGLITIVKSYRPVVYPGLALCQATAGYISPACQRADVANLQGHMYGRCSLAFKLMPKSMASFSCSEMSAAGRGVDAQFQLPIPVDDFMQRSHSNDLIFTRRFDLEKCSALEELLVLVRTVSLKPLLKRKKNNNTRCKPLPPSKRLRLEAQRN